MNGGSGTCRTHESSSQVAPARSTKRAMRFWTQSYSTVPCPAPGTTIRCPRGNSRRQPRRFAVGSSGSAPPASSSVRHVHDSTTGGVRRYASLRDDGARVAEEPGTSNRGVGEVAPPAGTRGRRRVEGRPRLGAEDDPERHEPRERLEVRTTEPAGVCRRQRRVVAVRSGVHRERNESRVLDGLGEPVHRPGDVVGAEEHLVGGDGDGDAARWAREQLVELPPRMRIGAGTGGRSCAARELRIESPLRVARGDVVETDIRQRAAVENDAAYGLGVSTHVRLSERGAVGAAEEIDLAVPKRATHDLQVVCSHTRRVEPRICVERGETASEITGHSGRIRSPHVSRGAGKTARAARATLVDHDEIAVSLDLREEGIHPGRSCRRRATRPALEIEQRARGRPLRRRQHRDLQGDHPPVRLTRILRNAQVRAPAVDIAAVRARGKMRLTARRMPRPGTPREPEHKATEPGDGEDREHRPDPTWQAAAGRPPIFAPTTQKRIVRRVTHRSRARSERCETSKSAVLRARTGTFRRGYRSRRHRFPNCQAWDCPTSSPRGSRLATVRPSSDTTSS